MPGSLGPDWGLEVFCHVGEHWLPTIQAMTGVHNGHDVAALRLLEFLIACICLYLVTSYGPGAPVVPAPDVFTFGRALGGRKHKTWWTVDAAAPQPDPTLEALMVRCVVLSFSLPALCIEWMLRLYGCYCGAADRSPSCALCLFEHTALVPLKRRFFALFVTLTLWCLCNACLSASQVCTPAALLVGTCNLTSKTLFLYCRKQQLTNDDAFPVAADLHAGGAGGHCVT